MSRQERGLGSSPQQGKDLLADLPAGGGLYQQIGERTVVGREEEAPVDPVAVKQPACQDGRIGPTGPADGAPQPAFLTALLTVWRTVSGFRADFGPLGLVFAKIDLEPGETVVLRRAANLALEGTVLGGHLVMTTDRLIYQCHLIERIGRSWSQQIDARDRYWPRAGLRATPTVIEGTRGIAPGVNVALADGRSYDLVVRRPEELARLITDRVLSQEPAATTEPMRLPRRRLARPGESMALAVAFFGLDAFVFHTGIRGYVVPALLALWSAVSYVRARSDDSTPGSSHAG